MPSDVVYNSKTNIEPKQGRYVAELANQREKSLMLKSFLQSSIDVNVEEEEE